MNKRIIGMAVPLFLLLVAAVIFYSSGHGNPLPVIKATGPGISHHAVYTEDGDILYLNEIKTIGRTITGKHKIKAGDYTIVNPVGIIENPPAESITDIYGKVLDSLKRGNNVLVIYIDGFGYELYRKASDHGSIPYLSSLGSAIKANTVYPSITDVAFASMVTGRTPKYTGIHNREKKQLPVPTIFDAVAESGKRALLIEGNTRIIIDEVETVLNIDEDKNGTIDDEIYERTLKELEDPPKLLMVHFHSFDDAGHKYGPDSVESMQQLKILDTYVKDILEEYPGDVIITADHGMHGTESDGMHGTFTPEDMFIPIITADKDQSR